MILVEFLIVYSGRASELYPSQLDNLIHIAIESFKIERVNLEVFHKLCLVLHHSIK